MAFVNRCVCVLWPIGLLCRMAFSPANRTVSKRNVLGAHINFCVQRVAAMRYTYKRRKKKTNKNPNHFLCVAFLIAFCLPFKFMFMTFFAFRSLKFKWFLHAIRRHCYFMYVCARVRHNSSPPPSSFLIAYSDPVSIRIEGSNGVSNCKFDAWTFEIQPSFALEYRMSWIIDVWIR